MRLEPLAGVLIARVNVEVVPVDLDVAADRHVTGRYKLVVVVHVLVLAALQELALDDSRVLLGRLEDRDRVVSEEERYDEFAVDVLRHTRVETGDVTQHGLVIVHILKEIPLWLLWQESINETQRIHLVSKTIVWRDLSNCGASRSRVFDLTNLKATAKLCLIEVLCEVIYSSYLEVTTESINCLIWENLIKGQVVVAQESKTWLAYAEAIRDLPSLKKKSKVVSTIIRVVDFSDFTSIICQVVVNNEWHFVIASKEPEYFAIIIEELLLRGDSATSKGLLHEFLHFTVSENRFLYQSLSEAVKGDGLRLRLRLLLEFKEITSILIAVTNSNLSSQDLNICADSEISREKS